MGRNGIFKGYTGSYSRFSLVWDRLWKFLMSSAPKALITGITGQDGAILAEFLLEKGYEVHGMRTYSAVPDTQRIAHLEDLKLHYGDMTDEGSLTRLLEEIRPDEVYNFAGMSHVHVSFDMPVLTAKVNALGPTHLLNSIKNLKGQKDIRFYQASSSEMFGTSIPPYNEESRFEPCSPYGISKVYAFHTTKMYRDTFGLHASNGILFNHESAIRGEEFVTRKITKTICEIEAGLKGKISLGNLNSKRDWGHAKDYMHGAWLMLQQDMPDDYVLATGESYSVRQFVEAAFKFIGIDLIWQGEGLDEKGVNKVTGHVLVDVDSALFRPKEIDDLVGDATKAQKILGWKPEITFEELVQDMMSADRLIKPQEKSYAA